MRLLLIFTETTEEQKELIKKEIPEAKFSFSLARMIATIEALSHEEVHNKYKHLPKFVIEILYKKTI
ncbi:MAG: hypothetical protein LC122_13955 [Chitinophagales bacterium]|nr:hypothetical protein [Chitinophagales bacterium]